MILELKQNWLTCLKENGCKYFGILSTVYLLIVFVILPRFLEFIETRDGAVINDPILNLFSPVDLTWFTFGLIYIALITGLLHFVHNPGLLFLSFLAYAFTATLRIISMYSLPLDPPLTIIPLNDPFVQFWGNGDILTKDLFFSGHTSTMFLLFLITQNKPLKQLFLVCTILVGFCVLAQHVHYTVDVVAAPFFAFGSYTIAKKVKSLLII